MAASYGRYTFNFSKRFPKVVPFYSPIRNIRDPVVLILANTWLSVFECEPFCFVLVYIS